MIDLYILNDCPYCKKVMDYLNENNILFNKFDTAIDDNVLRLLTIGGKEQVPFMHDKSNDKKLYESDDIVNYICENYVQGK